MLTISEPQKRKTAWGKLAQMLPHKSKDPLVKYVLSSGLIAFGAGLIVPLMAGWFGLRYGICDP